MTFVVHCTTNVVHINIYKRNKFIAFSTFSAFNMAAHIRNYSTLNDTISSKKNLNDYLCGLLKKKKKQTNKCFLQNTHLLKQIVTQTLTVIANIAISQRTAWRQTGGELTC